MHFDCRVALLSEGGDKTIAVLVNCFQCRVCTHASFSVLNFQRYETAISSRRISSLKAPKPTLHRRCTMPLNCPVTWSWSASGLTPAIRGCIHSAHNPFCFSIASATISGVTPLRRLRWLTRWRAFMTARLALRYAPSRTRLAFSCFFVGTHPATVIASSFHLWLPWAYV